MRTQRHLESWECSMTKELEKLLKVIRESDKTIEIKETTFCKLAQIHPDDTGLMWQLFSDCRKHGVIVDCNSKYPLFVISKMNQPFSHFP